MGALTQLWAGTSVEGAEINGQVRLRLYLPMFTQASSDTGLVQPVAATVGTRSQGTAEGDARSGTGGQVVGLVRGAGRECLTGSFGNGFLRWYGYSINGHNASFIVMSENTPGLSQGMTRKGDDPERRRIPHLSLASV